MKKYILVDKECNTADHHHIKEGKHTNIDSNEIDDSAATIMDAGACSPILAILEYPASIDDGMKMFLLHVWSALGGVSDSDGYVVVKEVPIPAVNSEQQLEFAIKAVGAIHDFPSYEKWAEEWLNNSDRTVESIRELYKSINKEIKELDEMQELAYMYGEQVNSQEVAEKKALFERAKLVFTAAELSLTGQASQGFSDNIVKVFEGIEEYVDPEQLSVLSDEILNVA